MCTNLAIERGPHIVPMISPIYHKAGNCSYQAGVGDDLQLYDASGVEDQSGYLYSATWKSSCEIIIWVWINTY